MREEKIKNQINYLFASAPKTRKAVDLKEEMTQNSIEKYHDLLKEGYSEENAFDNVIASIGDVTDLFESLEDKNLLYLTEEQRKKKAMLTAVAVGFYIFAGVVFFLGSFLEETFFWSGSGSMVNFTLLGLIVAGVICILPTCMLVYSANMYPDYHKKQNNSMVENYKETVHEQNRNKAVKSSINVIIWTLTLVLYFLISFITMAWYVTWVIFLIGICVQAVAGLIYSIRNEDK